MFYYINDLHACFVHRGKLFGSSNYFFLSPPSSATLLNRVGNTPVPGKRLTQTPLD